MARYANKITDKIIQKIMNYKKMEEEKVCSICFQEYEGFGNNAEPINKGRCCDECNNSVVQARLDYPSMSIILLNRK